MDTGTVTSVAETNTWICREISTQLPTLKPLSDFTGESNPYDVFIQVDVNTDNDADIDASDVVLFSFLLKERTI